jgi:molecular chaperone Hsp33
VRLIATDYFAPSAGGEAARMRAYANFDADAVDGAHRPFDLLGSGVFAMLIDQGRGTTPYQGMTPIAGGSLAGCAETYFAQSEQLPTRFALAMGEAVEPGGAAHWRGGGVLLQHMPKASPTAKGGATGPDGLLAAEDVLAGADAENWRRAVMLLETVEATELIGPHVGAEQLLLRLFNEEGPRVYAAQPVRFGCTCAPEKVVRSLSIYPPGEIAAMTTPDGKVTADCQFCGAHYEFDPAELGIGGASPDA